MKFTRLACLVCLAAACKLAAMPSPVSAKPQAPRPLPSLAAAPAPSATPGCDKQMTVGEVTLCSNEFNFNFKTGDVHFPTPLRYSEDIDLTRTTEGPLGMAERRQRQPQRQGQ